jgi:hypothetical protein
MSDHALQHIPYGGELVTSAGQGSTIIGCGRGGRAPLGSRWEGSSTFISSASSVFNPLPDATGTSSTFFLGLGLLQNSFRLACCGGVGLVPLGISKNLPGKESTIGIRAYIGESATKGQLASHATRGIRQNTKHHAH